MKWCTERLSTLKVSDHLCYWLGPYRKFSLSPSPKGRLKSRPLLWSSTAAMRLGTLSG